MNQGRFIRNLRQVGLLIALVAVLFTYVVPAAAAVPFEGGGTIQQPVYTVCKGNVCRDGIVIIKATKGTKVTAVQGFADAFTVTYQFADGSGYHVTYVYVNGKPESTGATGGPSAHFDKPAKSRGR